MCVCVYVCSKAVFVTCNKTDKCLETVGKEEGTEGSEGEAVGRKVWVLTEVKMKAI